MKPLDPKLVPHLRPARLSLAGVVAGSVAGGLLVIAQAFAVAGLLTAALTGASPRTWAVLLAAVVLGRAAASWVTDLCSAVAAGRVGAHLRRRVMAAALALGPAARSRRRNGELALLATRGVASVEPYLTRYVPTLVVAAVLPVATIVAIASQDLPAALVVGLTLPLVPVFAVLIGLSTRDRADRQWRLLATLSGHFVDVVRGLPTLVAFNRADAQAGRIRAITHRYRRATQDTLKLAFASSAVLELVATLSVALVAVVVGLRLAAGSLDLRTALVVLLLAPEAYWPLRRVGAEFHAAAEGTATFAAVDDLLAEAATAAPASPVRGTQPGIDLVDVTVGYPGRAEPVLAGFSAHVEPRGLTAVVGPSGAGKSTLLSTLLGHLAPSAGEIRVGGPDQVAWVPQRPWLLPGSIRDNVRLGRPEANDAEVWRALEQVHLAHHVAGLPAGLDTELGEDGLGFSAGERARLTLARVVVSDRPWVLLDEPTAHLDAETEAVVTDTLVHLAASRGVVVVAHRRALVDAADHVIEVPPLNRWSRSERSERLGTSAPDRGTEARSVPTSRDASPSGEVVPEELAQRASRRAPRRPGAPRRPARLQPALGTALGALAAASGVALTATAGWLIARAAEHPPVLLLMVAIVGVRTFGLARPALRYAERLVSHDAALRLLAERRAAVYDALVPLVPGRLGRHRGDVLTGIVDDVDSVVDRQLRVRGPVWTAVVVGLLTTGFGWWAAPPTGAVVAGLAVTAGVLAFGAARHGARRGEPGFVAARAALSARVTSMLQGAAELVVWQAVDRTLRAVDAESRRLGRCAVRSALGAATGRAVVLIAGGLGVVAVTAAASPALRDGGLPGPMLALLALLPLALSDVLLPLADAGGLSVRTAAAAARLDGLPATPVVTDPAAPAPRPTGTTVSVRGVDAGWDAKPVLRRLTVDLPEGGRLGVVGPSGSGKSTMAALLLRFLDPAAGAVALDDVDLRSLSLHDVRASVGLVDDDPHVFASSVLENLRLACPGASEAAVEAALRAARLGPWLDALPDGLQTMVGDGHADVSGGERARLALARVLLASRPVLVLDEPTAHLDSATAREVADALLSVPDRTVVWITHGTVGLDRMDGVLDLSERGISPETRPLAAVSAARSVREPVPDRR